MVTLPILYSFRRCPYAIRARMALAVAGVHHELREVVLRDKPPAMLEASPKATVPVLVLPDAPVIDESLQIMQWALRQSELTQFSTAPVISDQASLLQRNDGDFKHWLDRYKYADRYPEQTADWYRAQTFDYLTQLDAALQQYRWLHGETLGFCDIAIFPFVRQFAMTDWHWFTACQFAALRGWLNRLLDDAGYQSVMTKHQQWQPGQSPVIIGRTGISSAEPTAAITAAAIRTVNADNATGTG